MEHFTTGFFGGTPQAHTKKLQTIEVKIAKMIAEFTQSTWKLALG